MATRRRAEEARSDLDSPAGGAGGYCETPARCHALVANGGQPLDQGGGVFARCVAVLAGWANHGERSRAGPRATGPESEGGLVTKALTYNLALR